MACSLSLSTYKDVLQYFMERGQHHLHKLQLNPKTQQEERIVPNACKRIGDGSACKAVCKHGFPLTNLVSPPGQEHPIFVCDGIARSRNLKTSGNRNMLGQTLVFRNCEWINGCMPGLALAFGGSNTDISINDRAPITAATHDPACRRKRCIKNKDFIKATKRAQAAQSMTCKYFGGYIGKKQPSGQFDYKRCQANLQSLRNRCQEKSAAKALRLAAGRMCSDFETGSARRGAVELTWLSRNLHPNDLLFAECIRTFASQHIRGFLMLQRLEEMVVAAHAREKTLEVGETYIPLTKQCNRRNRGAVADEFLAYGLRPLRHPWCLLSVYEFFRQWKCVPLLPPDQYAPGEARTKWTEAGKKKK